MSGRKGLRPLTPDLLGFVQKFKEGEVQLERGGLLLEQEKRSVHLHTLLEGVLVRFLTLEDGRRQIVNFMFPGDFVGFQGAFDDKLNHSVQALLPARLCSFGRRRFHELVSEHPALAYDLIWLAACEETELEDHMAALGQRDAREKVAYMAVWLHDRAAASGISMLDGQHLDLPITQAQIADMLGLSLVHAHRTLKALARDGLLFWTPGRISLPDRQRAVNFAQYAGRSHKQRPFI
ncbi:Crp/Fnr family transcriptional regulator [Pseudopontixanthobacter vadosimaris]|uniref:Crp/Fnr family transcriptional regulator n=1 Tax=Pseudopontixanthobacter vadosimaris TaxID=2726450 RepID=UPI001473CA96|nr:Crp/Fnr family transcriptional regulator [Pseudopontixanthobacter vadosimaris]